MLEILEFTSSHESPQITTNCWTTITNKDSNLSKKIFYTQRQKRSHSETGGWVLSWYNQIPYSPCGWTTNSKIIVLQRFSQGNESSETLIRIPSLGSGISKRKPQSIWLWRLIGLDLMSSTGMRETETPFKEGTHKLSCALGPRTKQWLHKSWPDLPGVLEDILRRWGSMVTHCEPRTLVAEAPGILIRVSYPRGRHLALRSSPINSSAGSGPGTSQAEQPTKWEHSPSDQQTGGLQLSWANTHL